MEDGRNCVVAAVVGGSGVDDGTGPGLDDVCVLLVAAPLNELFGAAAGLWMVVGMPLSNTTRRSRLEWRYDKRHEEVRGLLPPEREDSGCRA